MILSNKGIKKALIRLRGCTGWSAPLFFANIEDRFSGFEAHIMVKLTCEHGMHYSWAYIIMAVHEIDSTVLEADS